MSFNDLYYSRLRESEPELDELDSMINEGLELHFKNKESDDSYDPDKGGRELLESLYEKRLKLQYQAATAFHPYSGFGRICLGRAQNIIDEYENEIGLLHTRITGDNVDRFKSSLTADLIDDIRSGRYQAIGALRYDGDGVRGVGALVYMVDTDRLDDEYLLRIKWLFVKEPFRRRGIATILLGSILWKNRVLENENVIVEVPNNPKWYDAYYNLLCDWHFDLETGYAPQLFLRPSEAEILDDHFKLAKHVTPLRKITGEQRKNTFDHFSRNDMRLFKLLSRNLPANYFDEELSCLLSNNDEIVGILLVHVLPSGIVRMEYLGGDIKCGPMLFSYLMITAQDTTGKDTVVELLVEDPELSDYFDTYYQNHLLTPMAIASLQKPGLLEDISPEDALWILSDS